MQLQTQRQKLRTLTQQRAKSANRDHPCWPVVQKAHDSGSSLLSTGAQAAKNTLG
jgi:hypothetical protein